MEHYGILLFLGLCLFGLGTGYPTFQQRIPNGEIVPSPCNPNHVWQGVGHLAKLGGGENNQFGLDFKANGYVWTENLCRSDSDGDGLTNGQELGDPNCTWKQGDTPSTSLGLSHPGFCDPNNPASCPGGDNFPECETEDFVCAALSDPDIVSHTVRLSESSVPAKETTYMCQVLDLPVDRDYHLVAIEPFIDNINVMHHIIVYGCTDEAEISEEMRQPNECFMTTPPGCNEMIALWAVGANGICYHEDAGFKVGLTGYKAALIEMHWNNPMEESSYTDSSGMTLHLTPNLRPNEAGILMIGQSSLVIPPGRERYSANSSCSSECTRKRMSGDIHIIGALNHMHYLGSAATAQMVTNKGDVHVIASDPKYSYDSPKFYIFDEPITMEPGYELQLECVFKSTSRSKTTFFGEGTSEEMCFAFLIYYPKHKWGGGDCGSFGTIDSCEWEEPIVEGCDIAKFADTTDPENVARYTAVSENCRIGICLEECKEVVREIYKHPCFQGPLGYYMKETALQSPETETKLAVMDYYYRMDSCAAELAKEKCENDEEWNEYRPDVGGSKGLHFTSYVCIVGVALFISFW